MKNAKTLTEGPLAKQILLVSLPLALSNLLQVLFNMSDVAVVGRFAGSTALGAVGSTSIFVTLFTGFLIGLSNGINVRQAPGRCQKDRPFGTHHQLYCGCHSAVCRPAGVACAAGTAQHQAGPAARCYFVPARVLFGYARPGAV